MFDTKTNFLTFVGPKLWPKMTKNGQKWPKMAKLGNFENF